MGQIYANYLRDRVVFEDDPILLPASIPVGHGGKCSCTGHFSSSCRQVGFKWWSKKQQPGKSRRRGDRASGLSSHSTHVFTWEWGWHMKKMMRWQLIVSLHFQPLAAVDCNLVPIVGSSSWREGAAQFKETRIIRQVDQEQLYLLFLTTTKIQMKTIVFDSISFWLGTEITSYKYSKQIRWKNCM